MIERTFAVSEETISVADLEDGSHVMKVGPDGTRIMAYITDGKLARYTAEDASGNRKPLVNIMEEFSDSVEPITPGERVGMACMICYHDETVGAEVCFGVVECPPFPLPDEIKPA